MTREPEGTDGVAEHRSAGDQAAPLIDVPLVRRLLAEQFPQWLDLPVRPVPQSGMDNVTFRLGEDMLVRLPRFARWVGQVEREHRWLPYLAPHLPLPVPRPLAMGEPSAGYPYPWSVYRWLKGETARAESLADPVGAGVKLAEFVVALRSIDAKGGPEPRWSNAFRGVPMGDPRDSIAVESRVWPKIEKLRGLVDTDAVAALWKDTLAAPAWDGPPTWIHGDLATGNLLSIDGHLSAVIDFGTLAVGDPACDLLPAWKFLPAEGRAAFRAGVAVDEATWLRGRGWALASSLPAPDDPYFTADPTRVDTALRQLTAILADA